MLFVLSPAKKLDYDSPLAKNYPSTQPMFVEQACELIDVLKTKSEQEVAQLMKLSDALAQLNVARYHDWEPVFDQAHARQAFFAFNGDVYEGLQARTLTDAQLDWAQDHVAMLSGLYGVLRPLDLIRPYRLEMGTKLVTPKGKNLYEFWGDTLAKAINHKLATHQNKVLINLASEEYFKSLPIKALDYPVIQCVFQEKRQGQYKIISFNAKRARGLMTRFAIEQGIEKAPDLKQFNREDYVFDPSASTETKYVFRR